MPQSDNFAWLIKARAVNQETLLRLYRFANQNSQELRDKPMARAVFVLLVGAGFSLWRAAFLSDAIRSWPQIIQDATKLLKRLVGDNAVAYPQDRETREWMAGYYLNNARWRLLLAWEELRKHRATLTAPISLMRFGLLPV